MVGWLAVCVIAVCQAGWVRASLLDGLVGWPVSWLAGWVALCQAGWVRASKVKAWAKFRRTNPPDPIARDVRARARPPTQFCNSGRQVWHPRDLLWCGWGGPVSSSSGPASSLNMQTTGRGTILHCVSQSKCASDVQHASINTQTTTSCSWSPSTR